MAIVEKDCAYCGMSMVAGNMAVHCSVLCAVYSRIDKRGPDECWPWTGPIYRKSGYSRTKFRGKTYKPYRIMCAVRNGPIPKGHCAMHSCDNRICCNPSHLRPGTHTENNKDMDMKGRRRAAGGEDSGKCKFTFAQVQEMRALKSSGLNGKQIADMFGGSANYVRQIIRGADRLHR